MRRSRIVAAVIGVSTLAAALVTLSRRSESAPCGEGFVRTGARCCPTPTSIALGDPGTCAFEGASCPAPLVLTEHGCDERERDVVEVPSTTVTIGPSDWEAEGRVTPRSFKVERFFLDRLEVSVGRACASKTFEGAPFCTQAAREHDPARAAFGVTLSRARSYCRERGGRLPSDDEWLAAAAGDRPRRYPWGDTGAVCRRAAWGLATGPCGEGINGPDTVGAHPAGMTPLGIHDLAGNVAEWVEIGGSGAVCQNGGVGPCSANVRGGSWKTTLATELRTWLRVEIRQSDSGLLANDRGGDPTIGFRCAYDGVP